MAQRRQSFRPRPLDPYKKLPVYRDANEFAAFLEDEPVLQDVGDPGAAGNSSSASSTAAGAAAGANKAQDKSADNKKKQQSSVPGTLTEQLKVDEGKAEAKTFNLPIPETEKSSTFDKFVPSTFRPSAAYIRHRLTFTDDYNFSGDVEYELTAKDEEWLREGKYGPGSSTPLSEDLLERLIDLMERKTGRDFPISQADAVVLCKQALGAAGLRDNKVIEDVYKYWIQKRQELHKPLLRRFWPVTATNDSSPHLTFRPREKERYRLRKKRQNDLESYDKLVALRRDFEMCRCLLQLVRRREHLHELEAVLLEDEFEQALWDITNEGEERKSLAPRQISVGPLPKDEVDPLFEVVPQKISTPPPFSFNRIASETASVDIASIEADTQRKKKKKRTNINSNNTNTNARAADQLAGIAEGAGPAGAGAQGSSDLQQQDKEKRSIPVPPPVPQKPVMPPEFLLDHGPSYASVEFELFPPIVAMFPPVQSGALSDLRRKQHQHQHQQLAHGPTAVGTAAAPVTPATAAASSSSAADSANGVAPGGPSPALGSAVPVVAPVSTPLAVQRVGFVQGHAAPQPVTLGHDVARQDKGNASDGADALASAGPLSGLAVSADARLRPVPGKAGEPKPRPASMLSGYSSPTHRAPSEPRMERPRYRCRPRIGRGGRFIVDRIPLAALSAAQTQHLGSSVVQGVQEIYAGPDPYETGQDFLDPCKPRFSISSDLAFPSSKPVVVSAAQRSKIQAIYLQEDSEDEDVAMLEYPYLAPLQLPPEDAARLEAVASGKTKAQIMIREAKFRFVI